MGEPEEGMLSADTFFWAVFAVNASYVIIAALQKRKAKTYPALRHHSDTFSIAVIVVHMLCGLLVVYGGCACWLASQRWHPQIPPWAAYALATATFGHSATNILLLRKVPGVRVINVPLYIESTVYNASIAARLNSTPDSHRELLLLWCSVSTYVWVRYFIFTFFFLTGFDKTEDEGLYSVVYTVSLPSAGVMGAAVPAAALGADVRCWSTLALLPAGVAVLAPPMIGLHKILVAVSAWPRVRNWGPASRWVVQFLLDTTNPEEYHGREFQRRGGGAVAAVPAVDSAAELEGKAYNSLTVLEDNSKKIM